MSGLELQVDDMPFDYEFIDAQFEVRRPAYPMKTVTFVTFLLIAGMIVLIHGGLTYAGYVEHKFIEKRLWPMIILGGLLFIPGLYHTRTVLFAMLNVPGYSVDDIPVFE